jgi:hypothetical protein
LSSTAVLAAPSREEPTTTRVTAIANKALFFMGSIIASPSRDTFFLVLCVLPV